MKPAGFAYYAPATRAEVLILLSELEDARVIAGGQSLLPMLNLRIAAPEHLIDLNGVPDLDGLELRDDVLIIGAMTRQRTAERSPVVAAATPLLRKALDHVGHQQTRNRGTVGGSIAHMDPTAELPVVAQAMDAVLVLESLRGTRRIPFDEWSTGYLSTQIEPDEILASVEFPCWLPGHGWGFEEVTRRSESYSIVSAAALVLLDHSGDVARAAVVVGGLGAAPMRLREAEAAFAGQAPTEEAVDAVAAAASNLPAEGDLYGPEAYKRRLARVLVGRVLRRAVARAREG